MKNTVKRILSLITVFAVMVTAFSTGMVASQAETTYANTLDLSAPIETPDDVLYCRPSGDMYASNTYDCGGYTLVDTTATDKAGDYLQAAGDVIYKTINPITDYSFGITGNWDLPNTLIRNGLVKVYVSADKSEWTELTLSTPAKTALSVGGGYGTLNLYTYSGTLDQAEKYRYIKATFLNPTGEKFNTAEETVYAGFRMFREFNYNSGTVDCTNTLDVTAPISIPENTVWAKPQAAYNGNDDFGGFGYNLLGLVDGKYQQAAGDVVFKFDATATDLAIYTVGGTSDDWAGSYKFYASSDNAEWTEINTVKEEIIPANIPDTSWSWVETTVHNQSWGSRYYKWSAFLDADKGYKYLKITFSNGTYTGDNAATTLRQIMKIDYNFAYDNMLDIASPESKPENVVLTKACGEGHHSTEANGGFGSIGYTLVDTANTDVAGRYLLAAGDLIYSVDAPITNYDFTIVNNWSLKDGLAGSGTVKIYVSSDKVSWTELTDTTNTSFKNITQQGVTYYFYNWNGTLDAKGNYKYIKAEFVNPTSENANISTTYTYSALRMLTEFKYNVGEQSYNNTLVLDNPVFKTSNTVWVKPKADYNGNNDHGQFGYNLLIEQEGKYQAAEGQAVFELDGVATDIAIYGICGVRPEDAGKYEFSVSADKKNWTSVEATREAVTGVSINPAWSWKTTPELQSGWGAEFSKWTATLNPDAGYKYLKITFTNGSFIGDGVTTALRQLIRIDYNTASTVYGKELDVTSPTSITDGTTWGMPKNYSELRTDVAARDWGRGQYGYSLMTTSGTAASRTDGEAVFELNGCLTDFAIYTVNSNSYGYVGKLKFYVSNDKENWVEIDAKEEIFTPSAINSSWTATSHNSSWGTDFYKYTGFVDSTEGYKYLKASFSVNNYVNLSTLQLIKVDYNTGEAPNAEDLTYLRKTLLNVEDEEAYCDFNRDTRVDVRDLVRLKKVISNI